MSELKWIKHDGGPMPVPGDTIIKIKRADGRIWPEESRADAFLATLKHPTQSNWWMDGEAYTEDAQIVEYAIVTPSPSAQETAIDAHYTKYAIQPMERQEGGSHYAGMAIQPVDYITKNGLDYLAGNVIKYISRHKEKGGAEDIRKAIHYCEMILERQYR